MIRLLPIAAPAGNDRTWTMFGELVHVWLAGLKYLPKLEVSGRLGRLKSDNGKASLLGPSVDDSAPLESAASGALAPMKGLPPPYTQNNPEAAALPGTLFWKVPGSSVLAV